MTPREETRPLGVLDTISDVFAGGVPRCGGTEPLTLSLLPRYRQKSSCTPVLGLPTAGAAEITSLSAINEFYSRILSPPLPRRCWP